MSTSKTYNFQVGMIVQDIMFETLSLEESGWGVVLAIGERDGHDWIKVYWLDKRNESLSRRCDWRRTTFYRPVGITPTHERSE